MTTVRAKFRRWAHEYPFTLALVVLLAVVLPGFVAIGLSLNQSRHAAFVAKSSADAVSAQADRNTAIAACLTTYAGDLTDALQDRDVIIKTARAAEREVWRTFLRLIDSEESPPDARQTMVRAIERYQEILRRLQRTDAINPYPDIAECLSAEAAAAATLTYRLMSYHPRKTTCYGLQATIRGSLGDDVIHGTDKGDVIRAYGGNDIIHGAKGNDYICGGRGDDTINGGQDYDRARGQRGSDFCVQVEAPRSC